MVDLTVVPESHPEIRRLQKTWRGFMLPMQVGLGFLFACLCASIIFTLVTNEGKLLIASVTLIPLMVSFVLSLRRDVLLRDKELMEKREFLLKQGLEDPAEWRAFLGRHGLGHTFEDDEGES